MRTRTVLAAAATIGAVGIGRRIAAMGPVSPELRTPFLLIPLSITNRVLLRVLRIAPATASLRSDVHIETQSVPGSASARVLVYDPVDRTADGALLWIHGGGYIGGAAAMDHDLCARFAAELGIVVVSVEYRLAPEHPFPASLDDCFAVLRWLHDEAASFGVDPARIAVGGASAGGGLAAALVQRAHDDGVPVAFQLLEYPMLDDRTVDRRDDEGRGRFGWTPASNRFGWASYLGHEPGFSEARPYAVPARRADLRGLPPAWVGVGELDLFFEEDVEYVRRLEDAGVRTTFVSVPGMYHGADAIVGRAPSMQRFRARMVDAVRAGLGIAGSEGPTVTGRDPA
jgi:acetyl esterase/lipase